MTRGRLLIGTFIAVFAGAASAGAQDSRQPSPSAERTGGTAVSRGDAGGASGGSGSTSSPSSSSTSTGGRVAPSSPASVGNSPSRPEHYVAPTHPSERQQSRQQRRGGDSRERSGGATDSGARAVPRGGSDSAPAPSSGTSRGTPASGDSGDRAEAPSRRAVPSSSRSREGRPQTGTAVDRTDLPRNNGGFYPGFGYNSFYYRSPYRLHYLPGAYGFGLGYFYDPLWYDPLGYDPYGYGYGYGAGGGYYGGSGRDSYTRAETGSVRLKVKPRDAQVYVDGYFVGDVDKFDGVFQRLGIDAGGHKIEIRADGYEPISFDVLVTPGETVTYKGELQRK